MKTNKETVLASDELSPEGRMMAKCLMKQNGLSIERLFNLLGDFQSDIIKLQRQLDDEQYDIKPDIVNYD
jgi:isocitrate dehydrogenase